MGQAWFPARALWLVIRMAGMGAAMRMTGRKFVLAPSVCMTLI